MPSIRYQRGDIYLLPFGTGKERPVVVVSRDNVNHGDYLVIVPFTTVKLEERKNKPWCAFFKAGEGSLGKDSVAKADEITRIFKTDLKQACGRIGQLKDAQMQRIVDAIRYMVRDSSLPSI